MTYLLVEGKCIIFTSADWNNVYPITIVMLLKNTTSVAVEGEISVLLLPLLLCYSADCSLRGG